MPQKKNFTMHFFDGSAAEVVRMLRTRYFPGIDRRKRRHIFVYWTEKNTVVWAPQSLPVYVCHQLNLSVGERHIIPAAKMGPERGYARIRHRCDNCGWAGMRKASDIGAATKPMECPNCGSPHVFPALGHEPMSVK